MIKLKASLFKSNKLALSSLYIGSGAWMVRRSEVEDGNASKEVLAAVLKPFAAVEMADESVRSLIDEVDRSVVYKHTNVLIDLGRLGNARLFVSDDGQVAPVSDVFVKLLELDELRSGNATLGTINSGRGVFMCCTVLLDVRGTGEDEEVRAMVMPIQITDAMAAELALCGSRIKDISASAKEEGAQ